MGHQLKCLGVSTRGGAQLRRRSAGFNALLCPLEIPDFSTRGSTLSFYNGPDSRSLALPVLTICCFMMHPGAPTPGSLADRTKNNTGDTESTE